MEFKRFDSQFVLRLDPDEEVRSVLTEFVLRQDIRGGYFLAFGAFRTVRLRYFDVRTDQYRDHDIDQQVEVVSLLGNVTRVDGKPVIHMHAAVSDGQSRTFSGHLGQGLVRPTLEVFLTKLEGEIRRERDPATGLDLLALSYPGNHLQELRRQAA